MARTNTSHGALEQQFDLEKMVAVFENRADDIPVVLYTGPADLYTDELANMILQDIPSVDRICLFIRPHPVVLMENRSFFLEMPFVRSHDGSMQPYVKQWTMINRTMIEDRTGVIDASIIQQIKKHNPVKRGVMTFTQDVWQFA